MMAPAVTPKVYTCTICAFEAASARQLSRHKAISHTDNPIRCVLCPFVTAYQTNLLRHRREVHGICGSKGNKSCKFCGFLSEDNETLIRHQLEVHRDILKSAQVKFAKEKLTALGEEIPGESSEGGGSFSGNLQQYQFEQHQEGDEGETNEDGEKNDGSEDEDDDKDFWKEGFMDDTPNIFMNLAATSFNQPQQHIQQQQLLDQSQQSLWFNNSQLQQQQKQTSSPPSVEGSISEFVSSRSSTPKPSSSATKRKTPKMPIPQLNANSDDLPATRIRRQYTCNDCGFRTINPREFLYHRRDEHGQRLKIVECPYCVYACQYVQKLQRHLLLVHKLETSMTPPPELGSSPSGSKSSPPKKLSLSISAPPGKTNFPSELTISKVPKIKVRLPPAAAAKVPSLNHPNQSSTSQQHSQPPAKIQRLKPPGSSLSVKPSLTSRFPSVSLQKHFSSLNHLQKKLGETRGGLKRKFYKCTQCGYVTHVLYLYKKHLKYHTAPKIKCTMCDFESPYSWNVDRHVKSHFAEGLFRCDKCSFACDKKQALTVHQTQHHRDQLALELAKKNKENAEKMQQENEGPDGRADDNETQGNDVKIKEEDPMIDEGDEADEHSIPQQSQQFQHLNHPNRSKTAFVRQPDGKIVPKQGVLKKCKYCQFTTDSFAKLHKHESAYHPEKKYKCPLCEIKFENLVWLQRHLSHMHNEDTEANNISNVLDLLNPKKKKPTSMPAQIQSIKSNHQTSPSSNSNIAMTKKAQEDAKQLSSQKKKLQASDKNATQCKICGYQTRWISELEKHMRVHTNERPFACPYCSFKSKWKGDLNRHIQKYHSRLPMPDLNAMEHVVQTPQSEMQTMPNDDEEYDEDSYGNMMGDDDDGPDPSMFASVSMDVPDDEEGEDEAPDDDIIMDDHLLPEDYEERPLEFDFGEEEQDDEETDGKAGMMDERELHHVASPRDDKPSQESESPSTSKTQNVKMYRCSFCEFTCSTASRFHVHYVQHLNTKPFQCSVCGHRSNWEWDVTKHIKMKSQRDSDHIAAKAILVHESGRRDYAKYNKFIVWVQEQVAEASTTSDNKNDFLGKADNEEADDDYNGSENNSAMDYDADPETMVITPDISFAVEGEDSNSSDHSNVVNMPQQQHQQQYLRLQPNVPYNSASASVSQQHQNQPTRQSDEKVLQCAYCDFTHKESKVMVSHLSVHAGFKPYRCLMCGFDSTWREVVVRHCQSRHGGSSEDVEQRFRCTALKSICRIVDDNGVVKPPTSTSSLPEAVRQFQETHQSVRISGFKGSFTCNLCPFRAEKAFHMDFHMKRHQPTSGPYKCPHCPYWVNAKKSLVKHMLLHITSKGGDDGSENREDYAEEEEEKMNSQPTQERNDEEDDESEGELVIYEGESGGPLNEGAQGYSGANTSGHARQSASVSKNRCEECPFIAGTKTQLLYHKQFHRPNRSSSYKCNYCSYSVSYLHLLNQHIKVHDGQDYQGEQLQSNEFAQDEESGNEDELNESDIPYTIVTIGNVNRKLYQCRLCPTTSKRRTYIYVHEQMHSKSDNESFKCTYCEFVTRDSSQFLSHLNIHKNATTQDKHEYYKSVNQDMSAYSTLPSVSIIDVNNIRHGNRRMFSYVCPDCPAAFKSPGDLKIHSAFHGANHPHPCPYCNYKAKNKPQLCKHLYVHTAEYISKRANSYPEGTKLLIGDAVDQMKRDLRSPIKETSEETTPRPPPLHSKEIYPMKSMLQKQASQVALPSLSFKKSPPPVSHSTSNASFSQNWHLKELPPSHSKRPSLVSNRLPLAQMIIIELTETKGYLEKLKLNAKHKYIYRCSQCPAAFMKVNTQTFHVGLHDAKEQFKCNSCSYSSSTSENIQVHQQLHSYKSLMAAAAPNFYNHRCDRCPAAFSKRSRLETHMALHGSPAKWKCEKCDYATPYAATLVKHRACHNLNPNFGSPMPLEADKQSEAVPAISNARTSVGPTVVIDATPMTSTPSTNRSNPPSFPTPPPLQSSFKMPQTPQAVQTQSPTVSLASQFPSVQQHQQQYPEEKIMFCCDKCPYIHHRRDAVQSHQRRHEQIRSNARDGKQCLYCDYNCLQPSYLRDHINWHFDPPQSRKPIAYADFNEVTIWKTKIEKDSDGQVKENKDATTKREVLFKDLGTHMSIRERFMPYEEDEELFELLKDNDYDRDSGSEDEDDEELELFEQENEAAQVLLALQNNSNMDNSTDIACTSSSTDVPDSNCLLAKTNETASKITSETTLTSDNTSMPSCSQMETDLH